jgi:PTH1 family peptidyl-tRNA hydrolase
MTDSNSPPMVVFLGNAGKQYERTRHNAGWMLAARLVELDAGSWARKFRGSWTRVDEPSFIALRPLTMMNRSGESVQAAARFFKLEPEQIIVAHDDTELEFGVVGFRRGGGLGGHNGLRSVETHLGSRDFWRIRIGVGRSALRGGRGGTSKDRAAVLPGRGRSRPTGDLSAHVLGRFTREEEVLLPMILDAICAQAAEGLRRGFAGLPGRLTVV